MLHYITMCQYYYDPEHLNKINKTDEKTNKKSQDKSKNKK